MPWWIISILPFVLVFFLGTKPFPAFASGFISVFGLWVVYAYLLSAANDHLLADKVAVLLTAITKNSTRFLFLFTGVIGGLVAGLSALTGSLLKQAVSKA